MDTRRTYSNPNLEKKRAKLLQEEKAADLLRSAKKQFAPKPDRVNQAFANAEALIASGPYSTSLKTPSRSDKLVDLFKGLMEPERKAFCRLLKIVEKETDFFEDERFYWKYIEGCRELAFWSDYWIHQPEDWVNKTHNIERQFSSLLHFLLAKYDVPVFMDSCFYEDKRINRNHQEWFIHIGSGKNLRTATNLPLPMTKMMVHHFLDAPKSFSVLEAFRYAHIRSFGGSRILIDNWLGSVKGLEFKNNEFWESVIRFFIDNPMLDPDKIAPIIDFINNQKFIDSIEIGPGGTRLNHGPAQPNFTMKGRNPETLLNQVEDWHYRLSRVKKTGFAQWTSCGIAGARFQEGDGPGRKVFVIIELLNSTELKEEGREMCHCVGSYSTSCSTGRYAIYSVRQVEGRDIGRKATVSVSLPAKNIQEARAKRNDPLSVNIARLVRSWASMRGVTVSSWAKI